MYNKKAGGNASCIVALIRLSDVVADYLFTTRRSLIRAFLPVRLRR